MGGEHFLRFHNINNSPCDFIHSYHYDQEDDGVPHKYNKKDKIIYKRIRKEIINFVKECYSNHEDIRQEIDSPVYKGILPKSFNKKDFRFLHIDLNSDMEKLSIWFHTRDKMSLYNMCTDICKLLCLAFPGKICIHFDRYNSSASDFFHGYGELVEFVKLDPCINFSHYKIKDLLNGSSSKDGEIIYNFDDHYDIRNSKYFTNLIYYNSESIKLFDYNYILNNNVKLSFKTKLILKILVDGLCIDLVNLIGKKLFYVVKYN